jgi:NAD(P)H-hydrate epimerase
VDIPSGWDVEMGNAEGVGLNPDVLISLTTPKEVVLGGIFLVGGLYRGRFLLMIEDCFDRMLEEKFELNLPPYPGFDQIVELPRSELSQKL